VHQIKDQIDLSKINVLSQHIAGDKCKTILTGD